MPLVSLFSKLEAKPLLRMLLVRFEENHPCVCARAPCYNTISGPQTRKYMLHSGNMLT